MGVCTEKDNLAVVMEYVEGRDLGSIVHDLSIPISNRQRFHIAKGIAQGSHTSFCCSCARMCVLVAYVCVCVRAVACSVCLLRKLSVYARSTNQA
jgi:serine/threonine protein kinase